MTRYFRVDVISPFNECDGYSFSVKTDNEDFTDDEILSKAIDKYDVDTRDYNIGIEEITDDSYEMEHWEKDSTYIE